VLAARAKIIKIALELKPLIAMNSWVNLIKSERSNADPVRGKEWM
jgi:hypothetical protein